MDLPCFLGSVLCAFCYWLDISGGCSFFFVVLVLLLIFYPNVSSAWNYKCSRTACTSDKIVAVSDLLWVSSLTLLPMWEDFSLLVSSVSRQRRKISSFRHPWIPFFTSFIDLGAGSHRFGLQGVVSCITHKSEVLAQPHSMIQWLSQHFTYFTFILQCTWLCPYLWHCILRDVTLWTLMSSMPWLLRFYQSLWCFRCNNPFFPVKKTLKSSYLPHRWGWYADLSSSLLI